MRKIIMKLSARNDVICFSADSSVLCNGFYNTAHSNFQNVLTMASNEVLILHVDASKKSDGECLCTGENRAATRLRKERKDRNSSPGPEVSIVSVKNTKPKRKKLNKSCPSDPKRCVPGTVTLLLSSGDEDEIEMMEVDSAKADKPTTSNASNSSSRTRNDSLTSPSTSSGSSSVGKDKEQGTGASKSTTDNSASTSSSSTSSKQQLESDYLAALRLSRALNSKPLSSSSSSGIDCDKNDVVLSDAVLAKTLQEKEYGVLNPKRDVAFVMESRVVIPGASPSSSSSSSSNTHHSSLDGVHHPNAVIPTPLKTTTDSQRNPNPLHRKHPTCWTECPSCPPDAIRKYHLIEVMSSSAEWDVIAKPVMEAGFTVTRMRRIQNDALWQRLCFEKQLMLRERPDVNEKFLYHTTRSQVSVICEEGLDQRLSRSVGNFGSGIYFSDDPAKCDRYSVSTSYCGWKTMFCCRVLLGHTKVYPSGMTDGSLLREPLKDHPLPGEPKTYDSVQGNLSGQNEFVVYNMYRVMPEYVIEYTDCNPQFSRFSKLPMKKTSPRKKSTTTATKRKRKK